MHSTSAVLVIGFDPRTGLAVARSLHRSGKQVYVGTIAEWEAPVRSRAIAGFIKLPGLHRPPQVFLRSLLEAMRIHKINTIIPITDRALLCLAPHDDLLRAQVCMLGPTAAQVDAIIDKAATNRLAMQLDIPVPKSFVTGEEAVAKIDFKDLTFPLFVKTCDKAKTSFSVDLPVADAARCANQQELALFLARRGASDNLLVQEHFPGDDVGVAILMAKGEAVSSFQYRARKLHPAEGGVCVLACTEKVNTEMLSCAVRLLRALNWEGIAQLDFRQDSRSGRFALLEINGRFWGSTAVAVAAGADFPHYAWQLAHGYSPSFKPYRVGLLVRWLEGDFRRLLTMAFQGSPDGFKLWSELMRFFADFRPTVRGMFWSWSDPLAGFHILATMSRFWLIACCRRPLMRRSIRTVASKTARVPSSL